MPDQDNKPDISSLRIDSDKKFRDRPRRRWWRFVIPLLLLAGAVAAYYTARERLTPATKVRIGRVTTFQPSLAGAELVATGYVVAQRKAEVASKGTGRLVYLGFEEGDFVRKGEVIARLDNQDIEAELELARADLKRAEVDTLDAGRNYRRQLELFKSGSITEVELETAETRYKSALANLEAARARVHAAEVALENTYIRAPFDGTILAKNADVGEMVAPFASAVSSRGSVVTLADMSSLEVEADVSESNIYKVFVGQPCEIVLDAYPGVRYKGYVKKIVPTADRSRATVLTKIAFVNRDERVLPEMSARVTFMKAGADTLAAAAPAGLLVPRKALTERRGKPAVFRVDGNKATLVFVTVGRELGEQVEVEGELKPGDRVILAPPGRMTTGEKVEIIS